MSRRATGTGRSRPRALPLAAVAAAALAAPAGAGALTPIAPQDVATSDFTGGIDVATGPQGQGAFLVTGQNNGPTLFGATRPAGGPTGPAQIMDFIPNVTNVGVAILPDGSALGVWSHATVGDVGGFATAPPGGAFNALRDFPSPESRHDLAVDGTGRAIAVWDGLISAGNHAVRFATRAPDSTAIFLQGAQVTPTVADTGIAPRVAANAGGEAVAAWRRLSAPGTFSVEAVIGTTTALPASPVPLTSAATAVFSNIVPDIGDGGHAVVAWVENAGGVNTVRAAFRQPGGAFGPAVDVAGAPGSPAETPAVHVDAAGTTTIAWTEGTGAARVVRAATRAPGGAVGAAQTVSGPEVVQFKQLDLEGHPGGGTVLAWLRTVGGQPALEAARAPAGGAFGAPITITDRADFFGIAVEPGGNVLAGWTVTGPANVDAFRVGGLDNDQPPEISNLSVPATVVAGEPAALSVTAFDWSGIGSVTWQLGGGATATGAAIRHTFTGAGTRTVSVRVTDGAGNATTATRTIRVVPRAGIRVDVVAPRATLLRVPRTIARSVLLRRGLPVRLRASEPARATVQLVGRAAALRLQARGPEVVLATRSVRLARKARSVRLTPSARLVAPSGAFRAAVRITLRDAAGNVRTVSRAVRVTAS